MDDIRFKGLKECVQAGREVVLFEVIVHARRHEIVHQSSDLPEFAVHDVPPFLMQLHLLWTH